MSGGSDTKSISQEYIIRTGKKSSQRESSSMLAAMMHPPVHHHHSSTFAPRSKSSQKKQDPFLNHIMKQINFLKVENLELKKIVNDKINSRPRTSHSLKGSNSRRRVSISVDNDLEPIESMRS